MNRHQVQPPLIFFQILRFLRRLPIRSQFDRRLLKCRVAACVFTELASTFHNEGQTRKASFSCLSTDCHHWYHGFWNLLKKLELGMKILRNQIRKPISQRVSNLLRPGRWRSLPVWFYPKFLAQEPNNCQWRLGSTSGSRGCRKPLSFS